MIRIEKLAGETSGSDTAEGSEMQGLCVRFGVGGAEMEVSQILLWDFDRTEPKPQSMRELNAKKILLPKPGIKTARISTASAHTRGTES